MRFLQHEHTDVTRALSSHGIDPGTVLFVKRRGRLHVEVSGREDGFVFFRMKATRIDDTLEWVHRTDYFIGTTNDRPCDWPAVLKAFESWLKK